MTYNPANLHECEQEKMIRPDLAPRWVDGGMTLVGLIASVSSLPQVIQIWQSHNVTAISLPTYLISLGSVLAWLFYGLYIKTPR